MYLESIKIQNFMAFKETEMSFNKGINLIIGDNGVGKTSMLTAISKNLALILEKMFHEEETVIDITEVNTDVIQNGESVFDLKYNFPVNISCQIGNEEQMYGVQVCRDDERGTPGYDWNIDLSTQDLLGICGNKYPLFSYQKFDRDWKMPDGFRKDKVIVETGIINRMDGYAGCINEVYGEKIEEIIQQWCLKMSVMEYEKRGTIKEFRTFQNIIKRFMQVIEGTEKDFKIIYSMKASGLVYESEKKCIPLYELSTGYKALLSMIMELAYRTVILNPDISDNLNDLFGIVLIDEIDTHLHPKWQWSVIDALCKVFPKVQFIIGTHSPIVISSAQNARIISLDKDEGISYLDSAYGYSINDVVTLRQGSTDMPQISKKLYTDLEKAIDNNDMNEAKEIVARAKKEYGDDSALYHELRQYYELNSLIGD